MRHDKMVLVESGGIELKGTLRVPLEANGQAVLIVPGSGPVDRNGNPKRMKADLYKDLALFLNERGIITLNYDKRGVGASGGRYMEAGLFDFVDDAAAWLRFLKRQSGVETVYVLGHSEGAIIGPLVFEKEPADGFVFLCGGVESGEKLLDAQYDAVKREIQEAHGFQGWLLRFLRADQKIDRQTAQLRDRVQASDENVIRFRGAKLNAKWYREMNAYDLREHLEHLPRTLAVSGGRDVQVSPDAAERLAELSTAQACVIADMNHLLRRQETPHSLLKLPKEYRKSLKKESLHPELLDVLATWFAERSTDSLTK